MGHSNKGTSLLGLIKLAINRLDAELLIVLIDFDFFFPCLRCQKDVFKEQMKSIFAEELCLQIDVWLMISNRLSVTDMTQLK